MLTLRKSDQRGYADHGWLKSRHTFSFADYYSPEHMGFSDLRVINEDKIAGGTGFGAHPHRDMEIISYVLNGALEHQDSMGNKTVIRPGEVQRMSAGTGVTHSEFNHQKDKETHFLQIWIMPDRRGGLPGYGQKSFEDDLNTKDIVKVVSKDGSDGSIAINQDASLYISRLQPSKKVKFEADKGRKVWLQVTRGQVEANGQTLKQGDGAALVSENAIELSNFGNNEVAEVLIFDLRN